MALLDFLSQPDMQAEVIFLDYYLASENGLSVLGEIRRHYIDAKIIFITSSTSPATLQEIYNANPHGILSKYSEIGIVKACLNRAEDPEPFIDPQIAELLLRIRPILTDFTYRELELLKLFARGLSIKDTAAQTGLSPHTVVAHRRKMMAKAGVHSIGQLLKIGSENGIL